MTMLLEHRTAGTSSFGLSDSNALVQEIVSVAGQTIAAALVVEAACADRIRNGALGSVDTATAHRDAVSALLDVCAVTIGGDRVARQALDRLRALTGHHSLSVRRVQPSAELLARTVDAMHSAAERGHPAAFETLLRRGLRLLVQPLMTD